MSIARHKAARLTEPAHLSGCRVPTVRDGVFDELAEFDSDSWRVVQRAVATKSFYGSSKGWYNTYLVSRGQREDCYENCGRLGKISVWLGKAFAFLRAALNAFENKLCSSHEKKCCV